jgi:hypothetical protein
MALKYAEEAGLSRVFFQDIVFQEDGSSLNLLDQKMEILEPEPVLIEKNETARGIDPEETPVHFCGIHTLKDVENLQKAIGKIPEVGGIRLIDFSEHEITFGIKMGQKELSEKILRYLDITNISIEERKDSIVVRLDPSTTI